MLLLPPYRTRDCPTAKCSGRSLSPKARLRYGSQRGRLGAPMHGERPRRGRCGRGPDWRSWRLSRSAEPWSAQCAPERRAREHGAAVRPAVYVRRPLVSASVSAKVLAQPAPPPPVAAALLAFLRAEFVRRPA